MKQIIVNISETEEKALNTCMIDIQEWVQNAISNRARKAIDKIILNYTDKNPNKLSKVDRQKIIEGLTLKTALEINMEEEVKIKEGLGN